MHRMMPPESLKRMVRMILGTRVRELDCGECLERLDRFVDIELSGKSAAEAMPLVQHHLENCGDCHQEYRALVIALQGLG
jgi:hypothetical protein